MTAPQRAQHHLPLPTLRLAQPRPGALSGTLLLEVIAPDAPPPLLAGWELRVWPYARLGDLTLEARPLAGGNRTQLLSALHDAGFLVLGLRERR